MAREAGRVRPAYPLRRRALLRLICPWVAFRRSPEPERRLDEKRAERLKAALRDNLRRRKDAARSAPRDAPAPSGEDSAAAGRDGSKRGAGS